MQYEFPFFSLAYFIASLLTLVLSVIVYSRRTNTGYLEFAILLLVLFGWSITSFMESGALQVEGKLLWSKWQYISIVSLAPMWLLYSARMSQKRAFFTSRWRHLIWLIPIVTLLAAFTNEHHWLLWSSITIRDDIANHIAIYARGPIFYLHIIFSYSLLVIGTIWLVKALLHFPAKRRKQIRIILMLLVVGWLSNLVYILGLSPVRGMDTTPLSFTFIALVIFWFVFRNQLFDLVPLARSMVIDNLIHGVIVINDDDVIIDINPAALKIIRYTGPNPVGISIWEIFSEYQELIEPFRNQPNVKAEIELPTEPPCVLDVTVSQIEDQKYQDKRSGQIITLYDITARKNMEKIESEQRHLAEALADSAAAINSSLELDDVLQRILDNVVRVVPHDAANISLVDSSGIARFVRIKGYDRYNTQDVVKSLELDIQEVSNMRNMALTGQPCINADTFADPDWVRDMPGAEWIRSYLGAPIISHDKLLGFIGLDAETPNFFKPEQMGRLHAFADQAAIAIENAQLFTQTVNRGEEMRILYEIGLAVTSGLGLENTVKTLFEQLKKVIPIDLFYLALYQQENETVTFMAYNGAGRKVNIPPLNLPDQPSLTRYTIEKKQTVYMPDVHAPDAEYPLEKIIKLPNHDERTHLGIPLILADHILGVLVVRSNTLNAYTPEQIRLVETIAYQASIAMDNSQLFEQMQQLAITDSLTGLFNRRYFFPFAENEIERSIRYKKSLSIILMDIDHFKRINDRFGHQAGDKVLKMVADICQIELRRVDVMCRFGGEEFIALLPETAKPEAAQAAQRICDAIANARLSSDQGEIAITVSIGVADLAEDDDINTLISKADKGLYQAKNSGRNQIAVY